MIDSNILKVISRIEEEKVFAIVRGVSINEIEKVVEALIAGGIRLLEVTFEYGGSMDNTLACVRKINENYGDWMFCGVGTATTVEQIKAAHEAGAQFVVSPNVDVDIIKLTKQHGMVSIPGALTPTEAVMADQAGADFVKIFPGGIFGIKYFEAISEVLKSIKLIAVGGINEKNSIDFLNAGAIGIGIGNYLVNAKMVRKEPIEELTARAKMLVASIK